MGGDNFKNWIKWTKIVKKNTIEGTLLRDLGS